MTEPRPETTERPAADLLGLRIGDYQVLGRLGSGGMADVYLAEQVSLNRNVALKVLKPELERDATYVARFVREAQAAAALVQSNIVQIYEVGERDGVHFIAQEYIPGRNLKQFITRFGAVQPAMAINVLRQTGLALQKAGEHSVTHRDIKPENIMLSPSGEVKVTDFGLARIESGGKVQELTQIGIAMGTPLYMSPEQIEGRPVDCRSDLYSLGVTAWHMLAGHPPFQAETTLALALKHVREEAPQLAQIRPDLPVELCSLIHRLMAKRPEDRYATATDMLRDLRRIKLDLDGDLDTLALQLADTGDRESGQNEFPTAAFEATRQLQVLMRDHDRGRAYWYRVLAGSLLLSLAGCAMGAAAAWLTPPHDQYSIADSGTGERIARETEIDKQYQQALSAKSLPESIEAFRSVERFFPPEAAAEDQRKTTMLFNRLAWLQLARLYLEDENYAAAQEYFEKLAESPDAARYLVLSGKIGLAWLADNLGLDLEAHRRLLEMQLEPETHEFLHEWVQQLLEELLAKYGRELPGFEDIYGERTALGQSRDGF